MSKYTARPRSSITADRPKWVAWAGGIVDGEGCIAFYKSRAYKPLVHVSQTDERMCLKLLDLFGGAVQRPKLQPNRRQTWVWEITGQKALDCVREFKPYLVVKGEQADILLEYTMPGRRGKNPVAPAEIEQRISIDLRLREAKR